MVKSVLELLVGGSKKFTTIFFPNTYFWCAYMTAMLPCEGAVLHRLWSVIKQIQITYTKERNRKIKFKKEDFIQFLCLLIRSAM